MKLRTLVARSLRFHWRSHLGVVLGVAVGAAVLTGALVVGDSVRWSLRSTALARLGKTEVALVAPDRFFQATLADRMHEGLGVPTAAVLQLRGTAAREDGAARINKVQVLGVEDDFWAMGPRAGATGGLPARETGTAIVNEHTARRLGIQAGDNILVRVEKPSALALEAPLSGDKDERSIGLRVTVKAVVGDDALGRFSLAANQVPPNNVYVPREWLQKQVGLAASQPRNPKHAALEGTPILGLPPGRHPPEVEEVLWERDQSRTNVLLVGAAPGEPPPTANKANGLLKSRWLLEDAQLRMQEPPGSAGILELRSDRVFIDPSVAQSILALEKSSLDAGLFARGYLTYLVNELRVGDRTCPYSMVTAYGRLSHSKEAPAEGIPELDKKMRLSAAAWSGEDEVVLNTWLAEDLQAKRGDDLDMSYYIIGPDGRLASATHRFKVSDIVPMTGLADDRTLMPDFPGLKDVDEEKDWKTGFPIDLKKIRPKDETYWKEHRGTPKAFIPLATGRRLWGNRFGDLTAIRLCPSAASKAALTEPALRSKLRLILDPASLGLAFQPVREQALAAAGQGTDFGQLFLGLSFFLVAAAVILTGLLFAFAVEQRAAETGTLLAVGFRPHRVRRALLEEGLALAIVGGLAGMLCGLIYTRVMLTALATVWRSAVGASDLVFHARPLSLAIGAAAGAAIALAAIAIMVRRQARAPARELLASGADAELRIGPPPRGRAWLGAAIAGASVLGAVALLATMGSARGEEGAGAFFGAGALLLIATLAACQAILARLGRAATGRRLTLAGLALRNATRRRGRSLATISLVACGAFLVIAVGANRQDAFSDAQLRSSGTGGFALVGEASMPILRNLNLPDGQKAFALPPDVVEKFRTGLVHVVALRVHEGDDASCLNLNRALRPRLLGVRPEDFAPQSSTVIPSAQESVVIPSERSESRNLAVDEGKTAIARQDPSTSLGVTTREATPESAAPPSDSTARFAFADALDCPPGVSPWSLLAARGPDGAVPAIGDATTITWSLGKKLGDTITLADARGRPMRLRLVGALAGSILQGSLIISDAAFTEAFPSESGTRMVLVDAPPAEAAQLSQVLSDHLSDVGLALAPAVERLAEFSAVENTYLAIFQALGGLGLALGSVGLGVVVLRNVLERRGELALLRAVGFRGGRLQRLVLLEHWGLLAMGLGCGILAALVAVMPAVRSAGGTLPYASLGLTLAAVAAAGIVWTWLATRLALRGPLLEALRNE